MRACACFNENLLKLDPRKTTCQAHRSMTVTQNVTASWRESYCHHNIVHGLNGDAGHAIPISLPFSVAFLHARTKPCRGQSHTIPGNIRSP